MYECIYCLFINVAPYMIYDNSHKQLTLVITKILGVLFIDCMPIYYT